jgi:hypothetical protein
METSRDEPGVKIAFTGENTRKKKNGEPEMDSP